MARTFKTKGDKEQWEAQAKKKLLEIEQLAQGNHKFYQLPTRIGISVATSNLSGTGLRLWIYLCSLFPFGDTDEYMPTQSELAARLGVSRRSILRAAAELEELDLWEFKVERWKGRNLTGHGATLPNERDIERGDKNVTPCDTDVTPCDTDVTPCDTDVTPETDDIYKDHARLQTSTDFIQTNSDNTPLAPQGELSEVKTVEVEVLKEETDPEILVTTLVASKNLNKDQSISKESTSRAARDNKVKVDYELLVGIYNEYKPKLWRVSKLTSDRESGLKRLYKQFGEDTAQRIIDALTWAETDEFYSGRLNAKRRGSKFDMDTLLRKTKNYVEKWSENLQQDNSEQPQVDAERSTSNDFDPGFMALVMAAGKENY